MIVALVKPQSSKIGDATKSRHMPKFMTINTTVPFITLVQGLIGNVIAAHYDGSLTNGGAKRRKVIKESSKTLDDVIEFNDTAVGRIFELVDGFVIRLMLTLLIESIVVLMFKLPFSNALRFVSELFFEIPHIASDAGAQEFETISGRTVAISSYDVPMPVADQGPRTMSRER